ncbi:MAG: shikimate kinase [Spirochaetaceae bacterium]
MDGPAHEVFPGVLFLGGIKHSGKSTLGRLLSEASGLPFYDGDDLTVSAARRREIEVSTARELYRIAGPEGFKHYEAEALLEVVGPGRMVLALGGGAIDNPAALEVVDRNGYLVYLHVDADILYERVMRSGTPAFLTSDDPYEEFLALSRRRDAAYRNKAYLVIELTGLGVREAFEKTHRVIRRQIPGWQ